LKSHVLLWDATDFESGNTYTIKVFCFAMGFYVMARSVVAVVAALYVIHPAVAQVQLLNVTTTVPGLSSTCIQVMNQEVACNSSLTWAGKDGRFETDETLNGLCSSTCASALSTWQRRVNGACGNVYATMPDGYSYLPQYFVEVFVEQYETLCLLNS
jgi:hypothetical protein